MKLLMDIDVIGLLIIVYVVFYDDIYAAWSIYDIKNDNCISSKYILTEVRFSFTKLSAA